MMITLWYCRNMYITLSHCPSNNMDGAICIYYGLMNHILSHVLFVYQGLPLNFAREHIDGKGVQKVLRYGEQDVTNVLASTYPRSAKLAQGWDFFVFKHYLKVKDTVVFGVISKRIWNVAIVKKP